MASERALTKTQQQRAMALPQNPVTALFQQFDADRYNVLAPVTHMAELPHGTRLAVTEVKINPDPASKEVFPIAGGQLMPSKVSLDRIAAASGISWLEEKRIDNARHPHYVEMFVRGKITDFDGTVREVTGVKALDLREDAGGGISGKDYAEIIAKAGKGNRDPSQQLMEARKFIQEIAASKAKNRAIASALGIKRSYSREELQRSFIVPKLVVDTNNAQAQTMMLANMLGATQALYGARPAAPSVVVEAKLDQSVEHDGKEVGEAPSSSPASDTEPAHDGNGELDVSATVKDAWNKAKAGGMTPDAFRALCQSQTGKSRKEDMSPSDVRAVALAVDAYLSNADDAVPV